MRTYLLAALACSCVAADKPICEVAFDLGVRHLSDNTWSNTSDQAAFGLHALFAPLPPLAIFGRVNVSSGSGSSDIGSGVTETDDATLIEGDLGVGLYGGNEHVRAWLVGGIAYVDTRVTITLTGPGGAASGKINSGDVGPMVCGGVEALLPRDLAIGVSVSSSKANIKDTLTIAGTTVPVDSNTGGFIAAAFFAKTF